MLSHRKTFRGLHLCGSPGKNKRTSRRNFECESPSQGCQMVYFQTKNPDLGKFLEVYAIEDVGILYGRLVCFYGQSVYLMPT
jgi:hypothetical protein